MVVGTTGNDIEPTRQEGLGHRARVLQHLFLVSPKLRFHCFLEGDCLGRNDVHQRPALDPREHCGIHFFGQCFVGFAENQATAGTAQGLMRGRGGHIGDLHRTWVQADRDEPCDMRHVRDQVGAHFVRDFAKARPVDDT